MASGMRFAWVSVSIAPSRGGLSASAAKAQFSTSSRRRRAVQGGLNKVFKSADEAVADIKSGSVLLSAGFGLCGTADTLIKAISRRPEIQNLTGVSNNAGVDDKGLGKLLHTGQVTKMIASYIGENKYFAKQYLDGKVALELTPQGTIAEKCRAGGAGIPVRRSND